MQKNEYAIKIKRKKLGLSLKIEFYIDNILFATAEKKSILKPFYLIKDRKNRLMFELNIDDGLKESSFWIKSPQGNIMVRGKRGFFGTYKFEYMENKYDFKTSSFTQLCHICKDKKIVVRLKTTPLLNTCDYRVVIDEEIGDIGIPLTILLLRMYEDEMS